MSCRWPIALARFSSLSVVEWDQQTAGRSHDEGAAADDVECAWEPETMPKLRVNANLTSIMLTVITIEISICSSRCFKLVISIVSSFENGLDKQKAHFAHNMEVRLARENHSIRFS